MESIRIILLVRANKTFPGCRFFDKFTSNLAGLLTSKMWSDLLASILFAKASCSRAGIINRPPTTCDGGMLQAFRDFSVLEIRIVAQ